MNLFVTNIIRDTSPFGGGMANVAIPLHKALLKERVLASLVSGNKPAEHLSRTWIVGKRGVSLSTLPADVVGAETISHIHGIWTIFEYRAFHNAKRRGGKIVMSPHGALTPWALRHKKIKKKIAWGLYQKKLLQNADLLVVNSTMEYDELRNLGLSRPIAIIPNGVNMDGFSMSLFNQPREKIMLFFSRLDEKKGIFDLIEAWASLKKQDLNNYTLHIQGHGDKAYISSITKKIRAMGLENEILMLPPVFGSARWNTFFRASAYVLPTYSENFGITIAEALLAGLPVITTTSTPWNELSKQGVGWIVENDIQQLKEALQTAINLSADELDEIRINAHNYALERFQWGTIVDMYQQTYKWLLNQSEHSPQWIKLD